MKTTRNCLSEQLFHSSIAYKKGLALIGDDSGTSFLMDGWWVIKIKLINILEKVPTLGNAYDP